MSLRQKFYIKAVTGQKHNGDKLYSSLGNATMLDTGNIVCTLRVLPLSGWDGVFFLFPVKDEEDAPEGG